MSSTAQIDKLGRIAGHLEDINLNLRNLAQAVDLCTEGPPPGILDAPAWRQGRSMTEPLIEAVHRARRIVTTEEQWLTVCRAFWLDIEKLERDRAEGAAQ